MRNLINTIMGIFNVTTFNERSYKKARKKSEKYAKKRNKGQKAEIWICGRIIRTAEFPHSKIARCENCGYNISYDPEMKIHMTKNAKKICSFCMLNYKKYLKDLTKEDIKMLECCK